ncbi:MAG: helix-turn-helix transcriptional regulator [Cyanobacteria bacterium NC_groundwater_1444_Ag_S-0.65um_54_12]|nr:helix-turn-helix transcriptional regulator [Cyanobacteria bacterium NC_groundwater_1444_Ag_S-0.65um_54_12]
MSPVAIVPTNQAIASVIRLLRKQATLTQGRLSQESGLSQPAISEMERGSRLDLDNLRAIASPLGISVWQLMRMAEMLDKSPDAIREIVTSGTIAEALLDPSEMESLFSAAIGE